MQIDNYSLKINQSLIMINDSFLIVALLAKATRLRLANAKI